MIGGTYSALRTRIVGFILLSRFAILQGRRVVKFAEGTRKMLGIAKGEHTRYFGDRKARFCKMLGGDAEFGFEDIAFDRCVVEATEDGGGITFGTEDGVADLGYAEIVCDMVVDIFLHSTGIVLLL